MAQKKSKGTLQVWQIAKINLRHNFFPLFLISVIIAVLVPILFGTTKLDIRASAVPLETLVSLIGIVLFAPIFQPEQDKEVEEIVLSKSVDSVYVYLIRIIYSLIGTVLLVLGISAFMLIRGCDVTVTLIFGTIADAMFLGGIGLLTASIFDNLPVAIMLPMIYYAVSITMKSKLGNFNLFAMMIGNYHSNLWLFATGTIMIASSLIIKKVIMKCR